METTHILNSIFKTPSLFKVIVFRG